jgi:hypothetical protein
MTTLCSRTANYEGIAAGMGGFSEPNAAVYVYGRAPAWQQPEANQSVLPRTASEAVAAATGVGIKKKQNTA